MRRVLLYKGKMTELSNEEYEKEINKFALEVDFKSIENVTMNTLRILNTFIGGEKIIINEVGYENINMDSFPINNGLTLKVAE